MFTNPNSGGHRGFCFVEFETQEDAKSAIDNMHLSELNGKLIKVTLARAGKYAEMQTSAVWDDLDFKRNAELAKIGDVVATAGQNDAEPEIDADSRSGGRRDQLPKVYFGIKINGFTVGKIVVLLRSDVVPSTTC